MPSNGVHDSEGHLTFARRFGKMIALPDNQARITAQKNNRSMTLIVHRAAPWVFLPI